MDHNAAHLTSSDSRHGNHIGHDHVTLSPSTAQHHHHHHHHKQAEHEQTTTTTATTLQGRIAAGMDSFHSTTGSLNSHGHHNHHHDPHGNDFDLINENVPGDHSHPSAEETHGDVMMQHGTGHMKPVFKWVTDSKVLFEHWTTSTILELVLAMLAAALLAAMYELVRNWLSTWDSTRHSFCAMPWWKRTCLRIFRSAMHALTAAIGYVQMLFAMTYDLRIFVCIILGCGLGFFILGPYFRLLAIERTQRKKSKRVKNGGERERVFEEEENDKHDGDWLERQAGVDESGMQMLPGDRESVL